MGDATDQTEPQVTSDLVHLHVHSEYSLLDGSIRIPALLRQVGAMGQSAVAITDHGNLFGAIDFYLQAKKAGIKPIIGAEIFWQGCGGSDNPQPYHLVLLAMNEPGYKNLIKIVSEGYLSGEGEIPVVPTETLAQYHENIIALSSCLRGEFGQLVQTLKSECGANLSTEVLQSETDEYPSLTPLKSHVKWMTDTFGDRYYVELIDNNLASQKQILGDLVSAAQYFDLPLVATCDAHYLEKEQAEAHAVLLGIKHSLTMTKLRGRLKSSRFHLLNDDEMHQVYGAWPEALQNTKNIADRCNIEFEFGEYYLPKFETGTDETAAEALTRISNEMLIERFVQLEQLYGPSFNDSVKETYNKRLEFELDIILKMGFPGYFLIVQDFINWAKRQDIPVGPGRGSGAGSLVAYALRITDIDPIPYNLLFERFLNPERVSMPDFDVDFCQFRREEVINYVAERYGSNRVAQITTFGKMNAKAVIRDVGRVLEMGYGRVDKIAKLIPDDLGITLDQAIEQEPRITEEANADETVAELLKLAKILEGLNRHTSVHAAGVVISEGPMTDYVPVYKPDGSGLVTQFEMKKAETVGLVKFDFLGLKTLTVIQKAVENVRQDHDAEFDIGLIPLDDKRVYQDISAGNTVGVFQLESRGMRQLVMKLKPSCFEDVIALVALFRPGPLGSGMVDSFIERKHGREKIEYLLPQLEPILKDTYGTILYQEQVMKIAGDLASYSLGEADLLRRAMGKKIAAEMENQKTRFVQGAIENKIDEALASQVFDLMAEFANYGFNKSHSAAYGLIAYQTAYLKVHYPEQYMAAIMSCDLGDTNKVIRYFEDCRRQRLNIQNLDVNKSNLEFDVPNKKTVGFGLAAIKGIGEQALVPIVNERKENGPFLNLEDFAKRVPLHKVGKKTLELLNQTGALDSFGIARKKLTEKIPELVKYSENLHQAKSIGQGGLFDEISSEDDDSHSDLSWNLTREDQRTGATDPTWLQKEKKLLGVYLTGHPLVFYKEDIRRFSNVTLEKIDSMIGKKFSTVCILGALNERLTKSGNRMASIRLESVHATVEAVMFQNDLPDSFPESGTVILVEGDVDKSFDGSTRVKVSRMRDIGQVRQEAAKRARITVKPIFDEDSTDGDRLASIGQLHRHCDVHQGETPLIVRLDLPECVVDFADLETEVSLTDDFIHGLSYLPFSKVQIEYEVFGGKRR